MRVATSIVCCVAVLLALTVCSSEAAERKFRKAKVEPGGEVLVVNHKRWDKGCLPLPVPTIKITRPPANGTATIRPGTFVIDELWHPDAESICRGQSVPGLGVYYRANPTFKGVDTFEYEVTLGIRRPITFGVDVQVNVK
jgi:hypothetical protein